MMQQTFHEQILENTGFMPKDTVLIQESTEVGFVFVTVSKSTLQSNKLTNLGVALSILVLIMQLFTC